MVKNLPAIWFDLWVGKTSWRRAWLLIPIFLPGESPWTEEPGGLQSIMGSQGVGRDWTTKHSTRGVVAETTSDEISDIDGTQPKKPCSFRLFTLAVYSRERIINHHRSVIWLFHLSFFPFISRPAYSRLRLPFKYECQNADVDLWKTHNRARHIFVARRPWDFGVIRYQSIMELEWSDSFLKL